MGKKRNKLFNQLNHIVNVPKKTKKPDIEQGPIIVKSIEGASHGQGAEKEVIESLNGLEKNDYFQFEGNKKYFIICVYALCTIAAAAFIIFAIMNLGSIVLAFKRFLSVISTFIGGFFIAFILNPLLKWLDSKVLERVFKIKRAKMRLSLSILITYVVTIGFLVFGISYVVPQIAASITDLVKRQEMLYKDVLAFVTQIGERFPEIDFMFLEDKLKEYWPQVVDYAAGFAKKVPWLINLSLSIAKGAAMGAINVLLAIAISIYMLFDKRNLSKMATRVVYAIIPSKKAYTTTAIIKECGSIFSGFVVGKSIDSLIIGIICFIAMSVLGLPYVMLISVIVGITNMIPYFGPFIGAIPGILLFLCIDPMNALIFTIMIFILQQFDGWILGPFILGESTGITPLWVIFAITVGGAYAGVMGMFLGVPVVAVLSYLLNRVIDGKLKKRQIDIS